MMIRVYIASPYSIGDKEENVMRQMNIADKLIDKGFVPFVPLLFHYQDKIYKRPYTDWLNVDLEWLKQCDCVLRLDGESSGADEEVKVAHELKIPVVHSLKELHNIYLI